MWLLWFYSTLPVIVADIELDGCRNKSCVTCVLCGCYLFIFISPLVMAYNEVFSVYYVVVMADSEVLPVYYVVISD